MKKVLVIDDNVINIKVISEALTYSGYKVCSAENGFQAVDVAKKENPQLILMDIQMPEMNGVETLKEIRKVPELEHTPVVAITAYAMKGDKEKYISEGFNEYMAKPVAINELIALADRFTS